MSDEAKPHPTPFDYDANTNEIRCQGAVVAIVQSVDDFPCLDPEEEGYDAIAAQVDATGRALAMRYNAHDELLVACKQAKKLLEAIGKHVTFPDDIDFGTPDVEFAVVLGETLAELEAAIAAASQP